jgi:hypothetical protein
VLAPALTSLQSQGGIQWLLDVILETTGTTTGFDSIGHFLRTLLVPQVGCIPYAVVQTSSCSATFTDQSSATSASVTTTTPPTDAQTSSTGISGNGAAALVDTPTGTPQAGTSGGVGAPASGAPTSSGLLGYLLGGSGTR